MGVKGIKRKVPYESSHHKNNKRPYLHMLVGFVVVIGRKLLKCLSKVNRNRLINSQFMAPTPPHGNR